MCNSVVPAPIPLGRLLKITDFLFSNIAEFGCRIEVAVPYSAISFGSDQPMPPERISARFA